MGDIGNNALTLLILGAIFYFIWSKTSGKKLSENLKMLRGLIGGKSGK